MPTTPSLRAALEELLAVNDLKHRIMSADLSTHGIADAEAAQALADGYCRREPLAWAAARTALAAGAAEPAPQKPVAWRYRSFSPFARDGKYPQARGWTLVASEMQIDAHSHGLGATIEPLYAAPVDPSAASMERPAAIGSEQDAVPDIDYMAAIHEAYTKLGHAQGTRGCIAFAKGAEWFRAQVVAAAMKEQST